MALYVNAAQAAAKNAPCEFSPFLRASIFERHFIKSYQIPLIKNTVAGYVRKKFSNFLSHHVVKRNVLNK
jgi:hypothetical protein